MVAFTRIAGPAAVVASSTLFAEAAPLLHSRQAGLDPATIAAITAQVQKNGTPFATLGARQAAVDPASITVAAGSPSAPATSLLGAGGQVASAIGQGIGKLFTTRELEDALLVARQAAVDPASITVAAGSPSAPATSLLGAGGQVASAIGQGLGKLFTTRELEDALLVARQAGLDPATFSALASQAKGFTGPFATLGARQAAVDPASITVAAGSPSAPATSLLGAGGQVASAIGQGLGKLFTTRELEDALLVARQAAVDPASITVAAGSPSAPATSLLGAGGQVASAIGQGIGKLFTTRELEEALFARQAAVDPASITVAAGSPSAPATSLLGAGGQVASAIGQGIGKLFTTRELEEALLSRQTAVSADSIVTAAGSPSAPATSLLGAGGQVASAIGKGIGALFGTRELEEALLVARQAAVDPASITVAAGSPSAPATSLLGAGGQVASAIGQGIGKLFTTRELEEALLVARSSIADLD